jgi:CheY-like chemotaxis protein
MVRELERGKAGENLPVAVSGVVTFASPRANGGFIVDDGDTGIYIATADAIARGLPEPERDFEGVMQVGMRVEVTGVTASGGFAPVVIPQAIRQRGTGPLPQAKPVSVADSGIEALQRIRQEFPEARVVMLTTFDLEEMIFNALEAGGGRLLVKVGRAN